MTQVANNFFSYASNIIHSPIAQCVSMPVRKKKEQLVEIITMQANNCGMI